MGGWSEWRELITTRMISNKNLLINWDFRNPVNQRGRESYQSVGYTIDRWAFLTQDGRIIVSNRYITLLGGADNPSWLCQRLESHASLTGKTLTLSVMLSSGEIVSCTKIWGDGYMVLSDGMNVEWRNDSISIVILNGYSFEIAAVKLELGSISTLANDPPANYGEQLALCQRYYFNPVAYDDSTWIGYAVAQNSGGGQGFIPLPVTMRGLPTFTCSSAYLWDGSNSFEVSITPTKHNSSHAGIGITMSQPGGSFAVGQMHVLHMSPIGEKHIAFDAEIY